MQTADKANDPKDDKQIDAKPIEQQTDQQPTTSTDTLASVSAQPTDIARSYSPIIEDPTERDSRPASTDPIEDRKESITPNLMDNNASIPPGSVSPILEPTRIASDTTAKTDTAEASAPPKTSSNVDAQPSSSSSQPIFRPLITEKGKSKTTGKTIGGWI